MAATDGQAVVAAARWTEEGLYLREFVAKHRLPAVAKIIKGQYGGIGVPSLPSPCVQPTVLLISAGRRRKILAQAVKIKEGRRVVGVGPKFVIPDTYQGYFELLSEDGRGMRCLESVAELAHRKSENGCLVRDSIRAIVGRYDDDGVLVADGARIVNAGETLYPQAEVQLGNSKIKFLRCLDSVSDIVLLGMDQKSRFSTLAKEDNISGVHTAKNLLQKRLPVTVRLVHGSPPKGFKNLNQFLPELRLLCVFEEEHVFAMPLQKDTSSVITLPLAAPLKLQKARNEDCLKDTREYQRVLEKCTKLAAENVNKAYVLDARSVDMKTLKNVGNLLPSKNGYFLTRSLSADVANANYPFDIENRPHNSEYDEIDLIYDYVRGFAPLPKNIRSPFPESDSSHIAKGEKECVADVIAISPTDTSSSPVGTVVKPEPPPIETIPKVKIIQSGLKAEKRTRKPAIKCTSAPPPEEQQYAVDRTSFSKLYVKNGNSQSRRLLRQKSSSPLKEHPPLLKSGSPIFNIRYKSLSNLQQAMELDGTLDSSNSGGKTSADSATGTKLPEKRSRRISRPRSLTNLVWDMHNDVEPRCDRKFKPAKAESSVLRRNSTQKSTSSHKRIGTLYL
ncbi:uncharacterized protein sano [Planococcus citri]|uniref:uncharacterized protein sano n=1 Tax=Planococcus citri TaxID=170843 RepID=UPI0031F95485